MQHHAGWRIWGLFAPILTFGSTGHSHAAFPPIAYSGQLGYDFRFTDHEGGDTLAEHLGMIRLKASTFLYQPWLALTDGSLGLTLRNSELGSDNTTATFVTGDARLRLFPTSRFPFEAFIQREDSTVDSDLSGVDFERTRLGVQQRYASKGGTSLRLRYEHQDLTQDIGRAAGGGEKENDVLNIAQFGASRTFGNHSLNFDSDLQILDRNDATDRVSTLFSILRDSYRRGPNLSIENQATFNRTALKQRDLDFTSNVAQLNSYGFWRPQTTKPLLVNATLLAQGLTTESDSEDSTVKSYTGTVGGSYEWSPRLLFTADAGLARTDSETAALTTTFQRAAVTYTSDDKDLFGFHYNWFAGAGAENNTDDLGALQSLSADLGHNVTRSAAIGTSLLSFSSSQSTNAIVDTEGRSVQILQHDIATMWSLQGLSRSTLARLSLSDSRTFGGSGRQGDESSEFQLINFQLSVDQRLGPSSTLNGNMTIQAIRQGRGSDFFGSRNVDDDFNPTASIDLSYLNQHFLNVQNLRFRSTLRFFSDSYLPLLVEPQDPFVRDDMDWENRLEYTVGRMDFKVIGRLSEFRDNGRSLIFFQVRRSFGNL